MCHARVFLKNVLFVASRVSACATHASSSNTFSSLLQQSLHVPRTRLPQTRSLRYFNSLCLCHASSSNTFSSLLQQSLHVLRVFLKHVLFVTSTVPCYWKHGYVEHHGTYKTRIGDGQNELIGNL